MSTQFFFSGSKILSLSYILFFISFTPMEAAALELQNHLINATPYDHKLDRAGFFNHAQNTPTSYKKTDLAGLFYHAKSFRYIKEQKGDLWQTPEETERKGSGDCEDKAVWLFSRLKESGYSNVRLVIGKYKSINRGYHVWVLVTDPTHTTYLLDPSSQKCVWKPEDFGPGYYRPIYSFDGQNRYRH